MESTTTNDTTTNLPPKVQKTTFTFKSDLRKSQFDSRPCCGIILALRSSPITTAVNNTEREEYSFAWIANYDYINYATSHLEQYGFTRSKTQFIPYSSKINWINKYPHAFPYVDCDIGGNVSGFPHWSPHSQSALDIPPEIVHVAIQPSTTSAIARSVGSVGKLPPALSATLAGSKKGGSYGGGGSHSSSKLSNTILANNERNALHNEIYNYFKWLSNTVSELETTEVGRRSVRKADLTASSLRGLLVKMEGAFKYIGQQKKKKSSSSSSSDENRKDGPGGEEDSTTRTTTFPLLEEALLTEMATLAAIDDEAQKKIKAKIKEEASERKKVAHWEPLDFELMFAKLEKYKEEHGHPNVPVKYAKDIQLGGWVSGLRTKKKAYDKDGGGSGGGDACGGMMDMDEEAGWSLGNEGEGGSSVAVVAAPGGGGEASASVAGGVPGVNQKYLTPNRISRLEAIGFSWSMSRPKNKSKSWDERLSDLQTYHEENGSYKVPRNTGLGEWLHNQRTLYGKRDHKFMTNKAHRMEGIGYEFNIRESTAVSWDERFQQLVEFHNNNGHFDVPSPVSEETIQATGGVERERLEQQNKFCKWVLRLHNEYRAYEKGTHSKLNADRIERLNSINFQFKGPKSRGRPSSGNATSVPYIAFEKRITALESFKKDTGHLNVDHNYKHCSNLGGWCADMSKLYKDWKSKKQQISEDMIDKFTTLENMGFEFNVLPYYESNRSWQDHYGLLLKYREHTGNARVPLKYKADLRLGKWVQSQRQQYKLLQEGKKSKLTPDRVEKLENAGFEWALAPGSVEENEHQGGSLKEEEEVYTRSV